MPAPKSITPDSWNHIVAVFLKHDGRILASAQELGWPPARAERVFKRGYPSIGYPPVKTLIARDRFSEQEIRARRAELEALRAEDGGSSSAPMVQDGEPVQVLAEPEQRRMAELLRREAEREKARQDALKTRAEEAMLIGMARKNAIALNAVTAQVLRGATELAGTIQRELEQLAANGGSMTVGQKLQLVRQAAQIARFNAESAQLAVKSERQVMGGGPDEEPETSGSLEESAAWIESSLKAIERARARGLLVIAVAKSGSDRVVTPGIHAAGPEPAEPAPADPHDSHDPQAGRVELPTAEQERAARRRSMGPKRARGLLRLADASERASRRNGAGS